MSESNISSLHLGADEITVLERYGFDAATFMRLQTELAQGAFPATRNIEREPIAPLRDGDLLQWPELGSEKRHELEARGRAAIERGEVAAVILNGGMATRFGGVVKGIVEVLPKKSFLGLRLQQIASVGSRVPVFLMNSFATDRDTRAHLEANDYFGLASTRVHMFTQRISIRLTASGEVFRTSENRASLCAPGHGDVFECLSASPGFRRFVADGGKHVLVSNIDNVGATLSPLIVGAHLSGGNPITVEVAARASEEMGGAPVRIRNGIEVLESFRFPPGFATSTLPVFNTNNMIVDVGAIRPDYSLTWFRADKKVEGKPAVQFERLMGQVTAFCKASYLTVPRVGRDGRFFPVKTPDDLKLLQAELLSQTSR